MIINGTSYHHSDVDSVFIFNCICYLFCLNGSLHTGSIYSLFNFNSCTCCGFRIKNEKRYKNLAALHIHQTNNILFLFLFSCLFFHLYFFQLCMGGFEFVCASILILLNWKPFDEMLKMFQQINKPQANSSAFVCPQCNKKSHSFMFLRTTYRTGYVVWIQLKKKYASSFLYIF